MKPSTWAILILSALLAIAMGIIVLGVRAAAEGKEHLRAAAEYARAAAMENQAWKDGMGQLQKSNAAQAAEISAQKKTIKSLAGTVAELEKEQQDSQAIAGAAVAEGADIKQAFDAGAPIVEAARIPALSEWYSDVGPRFDPLLAKLGLLEEANIRWGVLNAALRSVNDQLEAQNLALAGINAEDAAEISALRIRAVTQEEAIRGLGGEISAAAAAIQFKDIIIVGETVAVIAETAYIVVHALGWAP